MSDLSIDQAESWFLGRLLQTPERIAETKINPEHFTSSQKRVIFESILDLSARNEIIDVVSVAAECEKKSPHEPYWLAYCGQYVNDSFSDTFLLSSQKVMLESYRKRVIKNIAFDLTENLDSDAAITRLMDLDTVERKYCHTTAEATMAAIEKAQQTAQRDGVTGLKTGLVQLDKAIGGLQAPDLYVIGARPAMGKTAVVINFMLNHDAPVGFFSTEQPHDQVGLRMISATSNVSARKIRTATFDDSEYNNMAYAVTKLQSKKIHIYDKGHLTLNDLMREARRMKYNYGIEAIYVDYIQRVRAKSESRRLEVSEVVTGLKTLAKELQIPVIGLAQVNRNVEERADKRPGMGNLLESGVIEQEADVVMLLYRDEVYDEHSRDKGIIEIIIDKNRHGPTGTLKFAWLGETMQIKNLIREIA